MTKIKGIKAALQKRPVVLWVLLLGGFILPGIFSRLAAFRTTEVVDRKWDYFGGYTSDVIVALVLLGAFVLLPKGRKVFGSIVLVLLLVVHYVNFEHIVELGDSINYYYLHYLLDPTFVGGSMTALSSPLLFVAMVLAMLGGVLAVWLIKPNKKSILALAGAVAVLMVTHHFVGANQEVATWRAYNVIHGNVRFIWTDYSLNAATGGIASTVPYSSSTQLSENKQDELDEMFKVDLSGKPFVASPTPKKPNVLIVMIEGLSATVFPEINQGAYKAPYLLRKSQVELDQGFFTYNNYMIHAKQTNRGTYSTLCGDYPVMTTNERAAMYQFALNDKAKPHCLPGLLKENGYHTVYLQSANLAFMRKDVFMEKAGFDERLGTNVFINPRRVDPWGVDDRSFFEHALKKAIELEQGGKPWSMALMTSGTHHPLILPKDWVEKHGGGLASAYQYLDIALSEFLAGLRSQGLMENTIVVVTSDEIKNYQDTSSNHRHLYLRWGPLFVSLPGVKGHAVDELYAANDVAVGVSDYLGLEIPAQYFKGRSIFRSYRQGRHLMFGAPGHNINLRNPDGSYEHCDRSLTECSHFRSHHRNRQKLFHTEFGKSQPSRPEVYDFIKASLARNETKIRPDEKSNVIQIGMKGPLTLAQAGVEIAVVGTQRLDIPANSKIKVNLKCKSGSGDIALRQYLELERNKKLVEYPTVTLHAGDIYETSFTYQIKKDSKMVNLQLMAKPAGGHGTIIVEEATMAIEPADTVQSGLLAQSGGVKGQNSEKHELRAN